MHKRPLSNEHTSSSPRKFRLGGLFVFAAVALFTAYLSFITVRDGIASWGVTQFGGFTVKNSPTSTINPSGTPRPTLAPTSVSLPTPNPWNGASRVTMLVMGLDYRDWESNQGPPRTDSMILLTVDPLSHTAGVLSIPRDLWVAIPGMKHNKINTAHRFGELYRIPGGGPGLAMKTVEQLLGVPIDFYAVIDFYAFERFIDELGGVEVDVSEEIKVDPLGPANTVVLEPGKQRLDGPTALAYARNRYTEGGVFDRAERQHEVLFAIRDRILSLDMLPNLVLKAPKLYEQVGAGVHTNLTLEQAIQLAWLAQQIPDDNIKTGMIGTKQVSFGNSEDGQAIFKPLPAKIRLLRDEIFNVSSPTGLAANDLSPQELMHAEKARLLVTNSTGSEQLGKRTQAYLEGQGAITGDLVHGQEISFVTKVIDHSGKPYTIRYLVELMNIAPSQIVSRFDPNSAYDVELVLGKDWERSNPLP